MIQRAMIKTKDFPRKRQLFWLLVNRLLHAWMEPAIKREYAHWANAFYVQAIMNGAARPK